MKPGTVVSTILGRGQIRQVHVSSEGEVRYLVRMLDVPKDFYELRVIKEKDVFKILLSEAL